MTRSNKEAAAPPLPETGEVEGVKTRFPAAVMQSAAQPENIEPTSASEILPHRHASSCPFPLPENLLSSSAWKHGNIFGKDESLYLDSAVSLSAV